MCVIYYGRGTVHVRALITSHVVTLDIRSISLLSEMSCSFKFDSVIRGHHIYKDIWTPYLGELLHCEPESGNIHDPYAVSVHTTNSTSDHSACTTPIVGHIPPVVYHLFAACFLDEGVLLVKLQGIDNIHLTYLKEA